LYSSLSRTCNFPRNSNSPMKISHSSTNHGFAIEKRCPEGFLLCLVSRCARIQRAQRWQCNRNIMRKMFKNYFFAVENRWQSAFVDDSSLNWTVRTPGTTKSHTSSLAQRLKNHSSKYPIRYESLVEAAQSQSLSIFALLLFKHSISTNIWYWNEREICVEIKKVSMLIIFSAQCVYKLLSKSCVLFTFFKGDSYLFKGSYCISLLMILLLNGSMSMHCAISLPMFNVSQKTLYLWTCFQLRLLFNAV
jgi:hypothetical protein